MLFRSRAQLTQALGEFQRVNHKQVVVATVRSLQGLPIEDYGYQLGRAWGVGDKGKDAKDTGAILLVAPAEKKVRIEVGYGLEGDLTDAAAKQIVEQVILSAFRQGDFNRGVVAGTSAMLRTLGASPGSVMKIFLIQGTLVGVMGTLAGIVCGIALALNVDVVVPFLENLLGFKFLSKDVYQISELPSELRMPDVLLTAVFSFFVCVLATIYPSYRAAKINPAEALRYE